MDSIKLSVDIILSLVVSIFIVLGITAFWTIFSSMDLIKYLRKNKKERIKKLSSLKITKASPLQLFKDLPWADKEQNEIINTGKAIDYIYNNEDISDKNVRSYKKKIRRLIKLVLIEFLLLIALIIIPFLILVIVSYIHYRYG